MLLLFFIHLIKYPQRNVNMSHYDCIFFLFPYISSGFCFMYLCFLLLGIKWFYDVYLLCELYLLSLKYSSLLHLKINLIFKKEANNTMEHTSISSSGPTVALSCPLLADGAKMWFTQFQPSLIEQTEELLWSRRICLITGTNIK